MTTQNPGDKDLGDKFAEAAKPDGQMSIRGSDPDDTGGDSVTGALAENVKDLAKGKNPMTQGEEDASDDAEEPDLTGDEGNADAFSPGRGDQPE